MSDRWEVYAVDGYGKRQGASTYVRAPTEAKAMVAGKEALQMLGAKRPVAVRAVPYRPECDPSIRMHIQQR